MHSNAGFKLSGSSNRTRAALRYVTTLQHSGSNYQFASAPQRVVVQALPFVIDLTRYVPGGAVQQQLTTNYFDKSSDCQQHGKWQLNQSQFPLAPGVYYPPCDVQISGSNLTGHVSIVATGKLHLSGSQIRLRP